MTTSNNQASVILPCGDKKLVTDLTSNDKYELADRLVKNEVIMCVSSMVSEVYKLDSCEGVISEELNEIAYEDSESLDAKRECQLLGWEKADEMDVSRVYKYCVDNDINELYELADCRGFDKVYINLDKQDEHDYAVCDWEELAEKQGIDLEQEPLETLEYWAVTNWLASKLTNTVETLGMNIWGRACSGQAIALDGDIQDLAVELATFEAE